MSVLETAEGNTNHSKTVISLVMFLTPRFTDR